MKKSETLNTNRLKLCLKVKLLYDRDASFKMFYIDEGIDIKNKSNIIYENLDEYFRIRKGNEINFSSLALILPTDIIRDDFSYTYNHTFLTNIVRKQLLRNLVKDLSKMINGTFEENPHSRIEYKNDYWLFY